MLRRWEGKQGSVQGVNTGYLMHEGRCPAHTHCFLPKDFLLTESSLGGHSPLIVLLSLKLHECGVNSYTQINFIDKWVFRTAQWIFFFFLIFGCTGSLSLCGLFSSCSGQGLLAGCGHGLLTVAASRCRAPRLVGSVVEAHGRSCSPACGVSPTRGGTRVSRVGR